VEIEKVKEAVKSLLQALGENPDREGLRETPDRVARFYKDFLENEREFKATSFTSDYDQMVVVKDIGFYSLCEHHLLPFFGKVSVGYIPKSGRVLGLSKVCRLVRKHSGRLQIQERFVQNIAKELECIVDPLGCGVIVKSQHLCMMMRGVKQQESVVTTNCLLGNFREGEVKEEFFKVVL